MSHSGSGVGMLREDEIMLLEHIIKVSNDPIHEVAHLVDPVAKA